MEGVDNTHKGFAAFTNKNIKSQSIQSGKALDKLDHYAKQRLDRFVAVYNNGYKKFSGMDLRGLDLSKYKLEIMIFLRLV